MPYIVYALFIIFGGLTLYNNLVYKFNVEGGITGYISIMCLLLIEGICVFYSLRYIKQIFSNKINAVILLWAIYAVLVTLLTSEDLFLDIRSVLWWPSVYFVFYSIARYDYSEKLINILIKYIIPLLYILTVIIYFYFRRFSLETNVGAFEADNSVFFVLALLPFVFLLSKRYKYIFLILAIAAAFYSFKRSAALYTAIIIVISLYFDFWYHKKISLFKTVIIPIILVIGLVYGLTYLNNSTDGFLLSRFENISDDGGSGRIDIWKDTLNKFKASGIELQIAGHGFNAVIKVSPFSAHNDFLEMLYDFGIIGLSLYILFIILMVFCILKYKNLDDRYYQAGIVMLTIFFIMSMVSHLWLYPSFYGYLVSFLGVVNGRIQRRKFDIHYHYCPV